MLRNSSCSLVLTMSFGGGLVKLDIIFGSMCVTLLAAVNAHFIFLIIYRHFVDIYILL